MRTFFAQVETRYRAIKICPFTPAHVAKVFGGYMCFESDNDYRVWKIKSNNIYGWICNNSRTESNFVDYSEIDLNEFLQKNGYLEQ